MPDALGHIYIVLGTKAQTIKMAPIMVELQRRGVGYSFIHTGQHRETMDDLLANFRVKKPDMYLYEGPDITRLSQVVPWMVRILYKTVRHRDRLLRGAASSLSMAIRSARCSAR